MKDLNSYLLNESWINNDDLYYRMGVYKLNQMGPDKYFKNLIKKYNIPASGRQGVIKYAKEEFVPIISSSKEAIKRELWDLDGLYGETEGQLLHRHYHTGINDYYKHGKRKHDILTLFQCSAKKPYYDNALIGRNFTRVYDEYSDFACVSNPGIVPYEYSDKYPFRYDEWNLREGQALDDVIEIEHKDCIVNLCRLLRFHRETGYKYIIFFIPNPYERDLFDIALKYNIDNAKDWLIDAIPMYIRERLAKKYPKLNDGLLTTRLPQLPDVIEHYVYCLKKCLDKKDAAAVKEIAKERAEKSQSKQNESLADPQYRVLETITPAEVLSKFKEYLKDLKPSKDKKGNKLLYKSYYWTALDLLLIGLDGNLVKDIDADYWKLIEYLQDSDEFYGFKKFCFCYVPKCKNDKVSYDDCKAEAYDLSIVQDKKPLELKPAIKNGRYSNS